MPPPGNTTEFFAVVEKSGLLAEPELDRYRFRSAADPSPPDRVARWMLMDGRITEFQAELLLAGKTRPFFIGPYKVLSRIGNGSMGVVYLCEHQAMCRKVAVKILQKRRVEDDVALERFLREARASAALNHPNVVHALDFGCEKQMHFLVMEYIDGRSLKARVLEEGPFPPLKAANYLRQAALGLQHAHEAGMIHRDIKPSNIMIDRSGVVKLLDLGLALYEEGEVDLTQGKPLGTVAYIPPEQELNSHNVDARADIYSLGATFYLALAGHAPRPGVGVGEHVPPGLTDFENFDKLMSVLRRMTAPAPADRFQSAAEVADEMEYLLATGKPALTPPAAPGLATDDQLPIESDEFVEFEVDMAAGVDRASSAHAETIDARTLDTAEKSASSPSHPDIPSTPTRPRTRTRPASSARGRRTARTVIHSWLVRHWQPLILGLAVVMGFIAAIAAHLGRSQQ